MQGIYTRIPETNHVPREYGVAAILLFLFMVLISLVSVLNLLYFYISIFRSMCTVPNMAIIIIIIIIGVTVTIFTPLLPLPLLLRNVVQSATVNVYKCEVISCDVVYFAVCRMEIN